MRFFESDQGCIQFTLAGTPTIIRPSSWLVLLILGSAGPHFNITHTLLFVVAGMLCLLVHEFGHALSCRALGGGPSTVEIASMGGVTRSAYPPPTRIGQLLMVLAGPGASLLLGLLGGLALGLQVGNAMSGIVYSLYMPLSSLLPTSAQLTEAIMPILIEGYRGGLSEFAFIAYNSLFCVCIWWTLFNLLPIIPLDGSKALNLITRNPGLVCRIGLVTAVLLLVMCLTRAMVFNAFICATLAYTNWQYLRLSR